MKKILLVLLSLLLFTFSSRLEAQNPRALYRKGVKAEKKGDWREAEKLFRRVLDADSTSSFASYALANTLYDQGKYKEALEHYTKINLEKGELSQAQAAELFHNLGNTQMKMKQYPQAAEYYKQSLRLNPQDEETRYNLALALKLMEKNKQQSPQQSPSPQQKPQDKNEKKQEKSQEKPQNPQKIDPNTSKQILDSYRQDDDQARRNYEQRKKSENNPVEDKDKKRW